MEDKRVYYITTPGEQGGQTWTAEEYEQNKERLHKENPLAIVQEVNHYKEGDEIDDNDKFYLSRPGYTENLELSGADFRKAQTKIKAQYPDAKIARGRTIRDMGASMQDYTRIQNEMDEYDRLVAEDTAYVNAPESQMDFNNNADFAKNVEAAMRIHEGSERIKKNKKALAALEEQRATNPYWIALKDATNSSLNSEIERVGNEMNLMEEANKGIKMTTLPLMGAPIAGTASVPMTPQKWAELSPEAAEYQALSLSQKYLEEAKRIAEAPTRYEKGANLRGYWQALAEGVPDFLTFEGEKEDALVHTMNKAITKAQENAEEGAKVNFFELAQDPERMAELGLTAAEQELIKAATTKAQIEAIYSKDIAPGYNAGYSAAQSLSFMRDFVLTKGIGSSVARSVTKPIIKRVASLGLKGVARTGAKLGINTLDAALTTVMRTPLMASSWGALADNMTAISQEGDSYGQIDRSGKALTKVVGDVFIENLSEMSGRGLSAAFKPIGKAVGKVAKPIVSGIEKTKFGEAAKALYNPKVKSLVETTGFNGLFEELGEEWYGNALRTITGVDENALKDFATLEQQLTTLASFGLMTGISGGASLAMRGAAELDYEQKKKAFVDYFKTIGYENDQINDILDINSYETPEDLSKGVTPVLQQLANDNRLDADAIKLAGDLVKATARLKGTQATFDVDLTERRNNAEQEILARLNPEGSEGNTYLFNDNRQEGNTTPTGRVRYIDRGNKRGYLTTRDENGVYTIEYNDGTKGFVSEEQLAEQNGKTLNDSGWLTREEYLDQELAALKLSAEQRRMIEEGRIAQSLLAQSTQVGQQINLNTQEAPIYGTILSHTPSGYVVATDDGTREVSKQEMANHLGISLQGETDEARELREAVEQLARESFVRRVNDSKKINVNGQDIVKVLNVRKNADGNWIADGVLADDSGSIVVSLDDVRKGYMQSLPVIAEQQEKADVANAEVEAKMLQEKDGIQRDFRGNPLPLLEDGVTVDQTALWNNDPEAWAKWNDSRNNDNGADSINYITAAVNTLANEIAADSQAVNAEMQFDVRDSMKAAVAQKQARLETLNGILNGYAQEAEARERANAEKRSVRGILESENNVAPMSAEEAEALDADYNNRYAPAKTLGERTSILEEYVSIISQDSLPAIVVTSQNYQQIMTERGCSEANIAKVKEQMDAGLIVDGFTTNGEIYLMVDGINSLEEARVTYVHERQHLVNSAYAGTENDRVAELASLGREELLASLAKVCDKAALKTYASLSDKGIADELICRLIERVYTNEDYLVTLDNEGLSENVLSIIKTIDNEQRENTNLSNARRGSRRTENESEALGSGVAEDERNLGEVSNRVLGEEAVRPAEDSERGVAESSQVSARQTVIELYNDEELTEEEIEDYINANLKKSQSDLDKHAAKAPKMGTDIAKYKEAKAKYAQDTAELEKKRDFWKEVQSYIAIPAIELDIEPQNALELAARELTRNDEFGIKLLYNSLKRHTGWGRAEMGSFLPILRSQKNGGVSLEEAGEKLELADRELGLNFLDQDDPNAGLNTILELLSGARTSKDLSGYIKANREQTAKEAAEYARNAMIEELAAETAPATTNENTEQEVLEDLPFRVEGSDNEDIRFRITPELDAEYLAAVERGDMETAQRMVDEAAKRAGYDSNSGYQGSLAFNGAAPSGYAYYDTKEERIEAWENGNMEGDQTLGDYKDASIDIGNLGWSLTSPVAQRIGDEYTRESIKNLADAVNSDSRKIKVYRAVDADIKEDSVRNGDWVTPSRAYAEYHIGLQDWKEGRIIEQEVDIDDIWWDGNDINEWGYNDGKGYTYKNTPNNRKLLAPITYDDNGNIIPLSERFNTENEDIRFRTDNGSLVGMHNISEDKLRKAIKLGGLANPSAAVINIAEYLHDGYGEISLIMPSSLVDSETGDNVGTYTGDAWTPTYPSISRKVDDSGWKMIKDRIRASVGEESELYSDIVLGVDNYLDGNYRSKMEFVFLKERGIEPEIAYKGADGFVGMRNLEAILGVQDLRDGMESYERYKNASPMAKRSFNMWLAAAGNKQAHRELKEQLKKEPKLAEVLKLNEDVSFADFDSFTYNIFRKEQDAGNVDTYDTLGAAARYVDVNNLRGEFEAWLESLIEQAGAKEVFFAGYTRSGERIYKDNTLENVSRYMRMQGRTNAYDDHGLSATKSALLQRMTSLAQIRKNKARLQNESAYNKEYDALKDRLFKIISQLADMQEISDNKFMNIDYAESRLQEAITKRSPIAHLKKEYGYDIDPQGEFAQEVKSFIADVQKMPAKYFETKFERPVYLNEFAAAVMPTTTSEEVKQAVAAAGLPIFEYAPAVEGSRKEATLKATEGEGIRFRAIGEKGAANLDKAEEATIRLDNLAVARQMEKSGKDAKAIKLATGWERGVDKLWRYEVPDDFDLSELESRLQESLNDGLSKAWGIVYPSDLGELTKAYPDFNVDITVWVGEEFDNTGEYSPATEGDETTFGRSASIEVKAKTVADIKDVLVHEIQHAIQEKEGFAEGGSVFGLKDKLSAELDKRVARIKELREEGRDAEADELRSMSKGLAEAVINNDADPYQNYRKLAGEVEARNASARLGMSEQERRESLLSETEDVAREDQIVLMDGLGVSDIADGNGGVRLTSSNVSISRFDKVNGTNVRGFIDFLKNNKEFVNGKPTAFHIANAGDFLSQFGIKGKFMVGQFTFSRTHTDNADHKLGIKEWIDVINNLNNPIAITSYKGQPSKFRLYTYATINGRNICIGVNVSTKDGNIELSNIISAYGRDIQNLLGTESVFLLYPATIEELKQRISQVSTAHNSLLNATSSALSEDKGTNNFENDNTLFRTRITPEQDAAYLKAVESGDMETAQRMVLEAAKLAMPNTKVVDENGDPRVVYHGRGREFNVFEHQDYAYENASGKGFYFTDDPKAAALYTMSGFLDNQDKMQEALYGILYSDYGLDSDAAFNLASGYIYGEDVDFEAIDEAYEKAREQLFPNPNVVKAFINIERPYDLSVEGGERDAYQINKEIEKRNLDGVIDEGFSEAYQKMFSNLSPEYKTSEKFAQYMVRNSSQIKSAEPVTYDDQGNVIPLSQRFNPENEDIRFRLSNENQAIFVSNAARAVESIKMEKATPEQWLKMIEKGGGLKAGEDKWMGLSDWLKSSKRKTLTKQEVLDFINENMIVIEEQHYGEFDYTDMAQYLTETFHGYEKSFDFEYDEYRNRPVVHITNEEEAANLYNDHHRDKVAFDEEEGLNETDWKKVESFGFELAKLFFGQRGEGAVKPLNDTREAYTTRGLTNNHEIALTIPTIEPWNESDNLHFGDAGGGRAIAWIRFGDAQIIEEGSLMEYEPKNDIEREIKEYIEQGMNKWGYPFEECVGYAYNQITDAPQESVGWTEDAVTAVAEGMRGKARSRKILVIDEIQSKRHQEGREKGYLTKEEEAKRSSEYDLARAESEAFDEQMREKYGTTGPGDKRWKLMMSEEDKAHRKELQENLQRARVRKNTPKDVIPDAPFDKNWHELAMKRMLRYAAENGYDVVAWTKGDQQAERYGLQQVIDGIFVGAWDESTETKFRPITLSFKDGHIDTLAVNEDGFVFDGTYKGSTLADVVGKDMAVRLMTTESRVIADEELKIGGEGMRGFYDKMLPAFVNKYGKKWGVKVEDITLPNVQEAGRIMHSIPVTEEMKESVMEGQVMFRTSAFYEGRDADSVFDALANAFDGNYGKASTLIDKLESYFGGEIVEVSERAYRAMPELVPYPASKYQGEDAEYHHIRFIRADEDTFVEAVPFVLPENAEILFRANSDSEYDPNEGILDTVRRVNAQNELDVDGVRYRAVTDQETIDWLESGKKYLFYRNVVLFPDGTFGSPMASKLTNKGAAKIKTSGFALNEWEMAEEHPELVKNGKIKIVKPNGDSLPVAYNPYVHSRPNRVNTQFKQAWERPDLIYIETEVSSSDIDEKYHAPEAARPIGLDQDWNGGKLTLSRYDKPTRMVPWAEVADDWMEHFGKKGIHFDIIPPSLLPILAERGAKIIAPHKNMGKECNDAYETWKANPNEYYASLDIPENVKALSEDNGVRFKIDSTRHEGESDYDYTCRMVSALHKEYKSDASVGTVSWDRGDTSGYYDRAKKLIVIYTKKDAKFADIEDTYFHEQVHHALTKLPAEARSLGYRFLAKFAPDVLKDRVDELSENYKENEIEEEVTAWHIAEDCVKGNAATMLSLIAGKGKHYLSEILKSFNYDPIREFNARGGESIGEVEGELAGQRLPQDSRPTNDAGRDGRGVGEDDERSEYDDTSSNGGIDFRTRAFEDIVETSADLLDTHDIVRESGLVSILGTTDYATFMDNLYADADIEVRGRIVERAADNGYNFRNATSRILAESIYNENPSVAESAFVGNAVDALQDYVGEMPESDARWMLYLDGTRGGNAFDEIRRAQMAHRLGFDTRSIQAKQNLAEDFRLRVSGDLADRSAVELYLSSFTPNTALVESHADMYISVENMLKAIEESTGKKREVFEDVSLALNQLSSKNFSEKDKYQRDFLDPMWNTIHSIIAKTGKSIDDVSKYVMLKHGLERNEEMAKQGAKDYYRSELNARKKEINDNDALSKDEKQNLIEKAQAIYDTHAANVDAGVDTIYEENRKQDYSGLMAQFYTQTPVTKQEGESRQSFLARKRAARVPEYTQLKDAEQAARAFVNRFEFDATVFSDEVESFNQKVKRLNVPALKKGEDHRLTDTLWENVNAATKETLRHQYASGMISKTLYDRLTSMYQYYVPLRGFKEEQADDLYHYMTQKGDGNFTAPVLKAKGRRSLAENPFGMIGAMAESAIQADNKNLVKQKLYYFISNRADNGLAEFSTIWYEDTGVEENGKKVFRARYPEITKDMSQEEIAQAVKDLETEMLNKKNSGVKVYKKRKQLDLQDSVIRFADKQKSEHLVKVNVLGEEHLILLNANPRAAQAINGVLNIEADRTFLVRAMMAHTRLLSALATSANPDFVVSNFFRDIMFAQISSFVEQGAGFTAKMDKHIARLLMNGNILRLVNRQGGGRGLNIDKTNPELVKLYDEYVMNGGPTGYTYLTNNAEYDKKMEQYLRRQTSPRVVKAVMGFWEKFKDTMEAVEQISRFAAYLTAKEEGMSVPEAVNASKEVTLNFNRKGSGKYIGWEEAKQFTTSDNPVINALQRIMITSCSVFAGAKLIIMFYNATIQGLTKFFKLFKKSSAKMTAICAGMMMLGMFNAFMHMLWENDGDDDEKEDEVDDYFNIPTYKRRSTLCLGTGKESRYISIPISQELVPFYGLGDMIVTSMLPDTRIYPNSEPIKEFAISFGEWLPFNVGEVIFNEEGVVHGVVDMVGRSVSAFSTPYSLMNNETFYGGAIHPENKYEDEAVTREFAHHAEKREKTAPVYQDIARDINKLTGGDDVVGGAINPYPDDIKFVLGDIVGGAGKFWLRVFDTARNTIKGEESLVSDIPFVNRVMVDTMEKNRDSYYHEVDGWLRYEEFPLLEEMDDRYKEQYIQGNEALVADIEKLEEAKKSLGSKRDKTTTALRRKLTTQINLLKNPDPATYLPEKVLADPRFKVWLDLRDSLNSKYFTEDIDALDKAIKAEVNPEKQELLKAEKWRLQKRFVEDYNRRLKAYEKESRQR